MTGGRELARRTGLSRVEVIVLLVIFLLLTGFLLTKLAHIREESARTYCKNNLKQVTLSFHSYHDAFGRLPPLTDQGEGVPTGAGLLSPLASIIPYIEAGPVLYSPGQSPLSNYHAHSSVPFLYANKDGTVGTIHGGLANQARRIFIDPSDATAERLRDVQITLPDGTTGYYAGGSYAVNGQLDWGNGAEPLLRSGGLAEVILTVERPQVCRTASGEVLYNLWGVGFYSPSMPTFGALTPSEPPGLLSTNQVAPVRPLPDEGEAGRDAKIRVRIGRVDATQQTLDFPGPIQLINKEMTCDPRLPGSPHRLGMQVGMSDGSVRVFTYDTEPWVFWSACRPR